MPAGLLRRGVKAKERHHPVSHELVYPSPCKLHGRAHLGEIRVEHEDDVVRQLVLAQLREAPDIGEEDGDLPFSPLEMWRPPKPVLARDGARLPHQPHVTPPPRPPPSHP